MLYNQQSSKLCIGRIFDRFNIDYTGFIARVPNWIFQALDELDIIQSYINKSIEDTISDYKCLIPIEAKDILAVEYQGLRLRRLNQINNISSNQASVLVHPTYNYQIQNGYIITNFEEGDIIFYIKSLPVELDNDLKLYFPLIPKNEDLLIALDWYLLKRLLERGHNIPNYSLRENNEFVNPALAWERWKRIARNSMIHIDSDTRHEISKSIRTFIDDYNYWGGVEFNSNKIIKEDENTEN